MRAPCIIDGCEKPRAGRGMCSTHWLRWRKHGDPAIVLQLGVDYRVKPPCKVDGCEGAHQAKGYCSKHYARWMKHGDPLFVPPPTGRPLATGQPTWITIHKRLQRSRGSASEHICVSCGGQAEEWSYDHEDPDELVSEVRSSRLRYSLDLVHYVPRCVPCHRRFDAEQP